MNAQKTISTIRFPFQGDFQEFLAARKEDLHKTAEELAQHSELSRSSIANYCKPRPTADAPFLTPKNPEALKKLYDTLSITDLDKTFTWFFLYGALTLHFDPDTQIENTHLTQKELTAPDAVTIEELLHDIQHIKHIAKTLESRLEQLLQ